MPEVNYYKSLELTKNCSDTDIKRAYRKLAMKWHPDKNLDNLEEAEKVFHEICEAFEVLNNKETRAIYDRYGYDGLVEGVPEEGNKAPYKYKGNSLDIFEAFFGTNNPFSAFGSSSSAPFADRLVKPGPSKPRPMLIDLPCNLKELYNGCVKNCSVVRKRFNNVNELVEETKNFRIVVKPGWKHNTKITYPNEGDEAANFLPADIVFVIQEVEKSIEEKTPTDDELNNENNKKNKIENINTLNNYSRSGNNLIYTYKLSLSDALTDCSLIIPTFDDRKISIACPEIVSPYYEKIIPNEGMPLMKNPKEKGDLIIKFHILFPKYLNGTKRTKIRELLANEDLLN